VLSRIGPELQQPGLVGVQFQTELARFRRCRKNSGMRSLSTMFGA
jgi:hypothetical protein